MGWDKGVDYESAYAKIVRHMAKAKAPAKCYDAVLLLQLRNGLRVSEAVRAFKEFLLRRALEVEVRVSKKRRAEVRMVIVPRELIDMTLAECRDMLSIDEAKLVTRVKVYCRRRYGFNTHSLRYAFITFLLRQGVPSSIIAKITRHSRLDYVITYTQERAAEEVLRKLG
ncbi:MAG: tyrosine-type recombinase/integrase [Thermofilum sp.]|nr:tyrosine-type recombinase/integrase [Thermofilum sp.]